MDLTELFAITIEKKASDLHIVAGYAPAIRVHNKLIQIKTIEPLSDENTKKLLFAILTDSQKEELLTNKEIDFAHQWKEYRFRVNYYYAKGSCSATFRIIPSRILTIEELNLPLNFHNYAKYNDGLVLLTGPTGEGKTTTIASIINEINLTQEKHIITIEDPVEFVYPAGKSIVSQRELHTDTHSWSKALRSVLREDPDIVLIGEMRDFDTIQAALTIAETGHLVFSTLHTSSTPEAINRIVDVFPGEQQKQIRTQLASVLRAVVTQRLLPTVDESARVPALEILLNVPAVSSLIREGKAFMIDNILETGGEQEIILFEKYLAQLYKQNLISRDTAFNYAQRPNEMKKFIT